MVTGVGQCTEAYAVTTHLRPVRRPILGAQPVAFMIAHPFPYPITGCQLAFNYASRRRLYTKFIIPILNQRCSAIC